MVNYFAIRLDSPFVSFFFARLAVFLKSSSGRHPSVGLFVPQVCALRPMLLVLYPLIHQPLIWHRLNYEMAEEGIDVRSSELDRGLSI